jgi:multidrug resistance efflux pump
MKTASLIRGGVTCVVVLLAAVMAYVVWHQYMLSPWTRDARLRAEVVRIAPDVPGLVTEVAVQDNQAVRKGELLFVVDPDRYQLAVAQAEADLSAAEAAARAAGASVSAASAGANASQAEYLMRQEQAQRRAQLSGVVSREAQADARAMAQAAQANWKQAQASTHAASASGQQAGAALQQARVALERARLDLARTQVRASADGTITNLDVRVGDYASAGTPRMALVARQGMWVYGYFEETKLPKIRRGDPVDIRLMAGGVHLRGKVEGIATGIADAAGPTGQNLLAEVEPTFNWVRLAQRVPVRVSIDPESIPDGAVLSAGMSATLVIKHGEDDKQKAG